MKNTEKSAVQNTDTREGCCKYPGVEVQTHI